MQVGIAICLKLDNSDKHERLAKLPLKVHTHLPPDVVKKSYFFFGTPSLVHLLGIERQRQKSP
jgi:hypothetical protein